MAKKTSKKVAREVVEATPQPPPAPAEDAPKKKATTPKAPKKVKVYSFIKNYSPKQPIILEGHNRPFVMPTNPFETADEKLAESIRKVAAQYKIIENPSTEV